MYLGEDEGRRLPNGVVALFYGQVGRYLDWGVSQKLNIPGAVRDWGEFQPCYFKEEGRLRLLLLRLRLVRRCIHITRPKSRVDALVSLNFEARQG